MNYYIQGDAAKADKIKAAFEKKGYNVTGFDICNDNILFFTYKLEGGGKVISTTNVNLYTANIIKTHPDYTELELPVEPKFKVGDWVVWTEPNGDKPAEPVKIIQLIDEDQLYRVDMGNGIGHISYDMQDYYKLVQKPHYDIANFKPFDHCRFKPTKAHDWMYADFWYIQNHYNVESLAEIERWES